MVFIEYYISYTGANMGPNGNIKHNKQKESLFFFFLWQIILKHNQGYRLKYGILEIVAHV